MKQQSDKSTIDIFTESRAVGRPRKHISNAAKQAAYRQRLKQRKALMAGTKNNEYSK